MFNNLAEQRKPLLLWAVATLFFAFQFILRLSVGILREDIMTRYQIDTVMFGSLAGFYYLGYSGMQIPFGIMLDRFNFRAIIILAIVITALGTLPFIFSSNWQYVLLGRFLIGAGSAAGFLAVTKVIKLFFKEEYHSKMIGFSFTFGLLGAVFGGKPMKLIFNNFGYEAGFAILIFLSLKIAFIIFAVQDKSIKRVEEQTKNILTFQDVLNLLFSPKILLIGISGGLMVGSLEGFADVWAIPFFHDIYNISVEDSILATSFVYVGMCFGGPLLAYFSDLVQSENKVILITNLLMITVFVALFYISNWNFYILSSLMFFLGILCCYQVIVFTKVSKIVNKNVTGLAIAITNCLNMSFGYLFHYFISYLIQANTDFLSADSSLVKYSFNSYLISLSIIPIACFVGQIGFSYISFLEKRKLD